MQIKIPRQKQKAGWGQIRIRDDKGRQAVLWSLRKRDPVGSRPGPSGGTRFEGMGGGRLALDSWVRRWKVHAGLGEAAVVQACASCKLTFQSPS